MPRISREDDDTEIGSNLFSQSYTECVEATGEQEDEEEDRPRRRTSRRVRARRATY